MARFFNLFSGSKGNCTYIGSSDSGILVDAGRSAKQITEALTDRNFDISSVQGIFVTHEHSDHVSALKVLLNKYDIPIFATNGTADRLEQGGYIPKNKEVIRLDFSTETSISDLKISLFETSHDSAQSCGYRIETPDGRKIAVCTDLGYMSREVVDGINGCDLVMIESNHDINMLKMSSYPQLLKRRILGSRGHLSNDDCAEILPTLIKGGTTRICLAHLSNENNMPCLAQKTAEQSLLSDGITIGNDCLLSVLEEKSTKGVTVF